MGKKKQKRGSSRPMDIESCPTEYSSSTLDGSSYHYHPPSRPRSTRSLKDQVESLREQGHRAEVEDNAVANALANRAFHLPGYGYLADWCQYIINNHLVFGLCCRHPQHPISTKLRFYNLLGSALFGLAITNIIWLCYIYYDADPDSVLFKISFYDQETTELIASKNNWTNNDDYLFHNGTNATGTGTEPYSFNTVTNINWTEDLTTATPSPLLGQGQDEDESKPGFEIFLPRPKNEQTAETLGNTLQVTRGMVLLWTVGAALHAVFDNIIWRVSACGCCLPGNRCARLSFLRGMGSAFTVLMVTLVTAIATLAVVLRATLTSHPDDLVDFSDSQSGGLVDDAIDVTASFKEAAKNLGAFEFVMGYFVEFLLALFVYHPMFMTMLFAGWFNWMGCGRIRFLGGRPFEMRQLEEAQERLGQRVRNEGLVAGSHCLSSIPRGHSESRLTGSQCLSVPKKGSTRSPGRWSQTERSSYSSVSSR